MNNTPKKKKKWWIWLIVLVVVAALVVVGLILAQGMAARRAEASTYKTVTVQTGDITKTVTSTGTLQAQDTITLSTVGGVKLNEVLVKVGDAVKAGQPIASLDSAALGQTASKLNSDITQLSAQLSRMNGQTAPDEIKSPVDGRVMQIYAQKGGNAADIIAGSGALVVLSTDGKMKVALSALSSPVTVNQKLTVQLENGKKVTGYVASVSADGTGCVVTIDDKGANVGEKVTVYNLSQQLGEGALSINKPLPVTALGGTVESIKVKLNEEVSRNDTLVTIKDEPSSNSYDTQYYDLQSKIADYAQVQKLILYPMLVFPVDGVISDLNIQDDMTIAVDSAVAKLHTNGLNVVVGVDELDMPQIKIGQDAKLTMDALPGKEMPAKIVKISPLGNSQSGATTYDVTLDFQSSDSLYEGMNVTANITVDHRSNAILIPLDALQESNGETFVYMAGDKKNGLGEKRTVTTGISDGTNVEVLTGLQSGEKIIYQPKVTGQQSQDAGMRQLFNGGGTNRQQASPAATGGK